jgi:hypothetical protein
MRVWGWVHGRGRKGLGSGTSCRALGESDCGSHCDVSMRLDRGLHSVSVSAAARLQLESVAGNLGQGLGFAV